MQWSKVLFLALAATSTALVRFQCSQLVVQRLDPLVDPGLIPSSHVHQIVGGVRPISQESDNKYLTCRNRIRSTLLWIPRKICQENRLAQPANSAKTSPTTGPLFCISKRETVHINAFTNSPMLGSMDLRVAGRCWERNLLPYLHLFMFFSEDYGISPNFL
jgi:hypothetical protein